MVNKVISILFTMLFAVAFTVNCGSKSEDKTGQNLLLFKLVAPEAFDKLFGLNSQDNCTPPNPDPTKKTDQLGLSHCTAEKDKWTKVPQNVQFSSLAAKFNLRSSNVRALPSAVNLWEPSSGKKFFPKIGNQGQYGTCVAWAVGYNMKSFMEGIDQNSSPSTDAQYFSPKYLFWSIPNSQKGKSCGGTGFESALESIIKNGIPSLATVPYTDMGNCDYGKATSDPNWANWSSVASSFKIENYRKLNEKKRAEIKENIANNRPVVIGAKLGDKFMQWNSADVLKGPETYDYNGQHAYHAMIIGGYDDSKNAYLVINSWGESWGNKGTIWVDYDFFEKEFGFAAFVAKNIKSDKTVKPDNTDDQKAKDDGSDMLANSIQFYASLENKANQYELAYSIYNEGKTAVKVSDGSTSQWLAALIYYNATDANDFGIIYYDKFTKSGLTSSQACSTKKDANNGNAQYCEWNIDFPLGGKLTRTYSNSISTTSTVPITMPNITGDYYLMLVVDTDDDITELDEANNYAWSTTEPITFSSGAVASSSKSQIINTSATSSIRFARVSSSLPINVTNMKDSHYNTYTPEEFRYLLRNEALVRSMMPARNTVPGEAPSTRIINPPSTF